MSDTDFVMQAILISSFSVVGICVIGNYIRTKYIQSKNIVPVMKQSPSMEELTSIGPEDPSVNN